ncbi:transcription elongation factor GreA [Anaplasmataceae bacterium AB001_6]|nr:transcription elongation factor GreA [Anaplasmataceae bacterium AB001_6]
MVSNNNNSMNTSYITSEEKKKLLDTISDLYKQRIKALKEKEDAAAMGDLSENSEYKEAIRMLAIIDRNLMRYNKIISSSSAVDPSKLTGDTVKFGATVTVMDIETDKERTYQIVSEYGASIETHSISILSPLGKALIGKKTGDYIEFFTPKGFKNYQVIDIKYI